MYADAPYAARAYADPERVAGIANGSSDIWGTLKFVIYAASQAFASNPDDSVAPSRPYLGTLETAITFRRSIIGSGEIGTFTTGAGTTVLNNADSRYDFLPSQFTADGRPIEIKIMRKGDDLSAAFTVLKGVMQSWFVDENQVAVTVRDYGFKLDVPAQPNVYLGTSGLEGFEDLAQKRKPMTFGYVSNMTPVLVRPDLLVYQVHDGSVQAIPAVYDRGAAKSFHADYADYAALAAASVPSGKFATCRALGIFRVNEILDGSVITADVQGDNQGGFVSMTSAIVRRWLLRVSDLTAADLYTPSFDNLASTQPAPVGYTIGPDDDVSIADVIADLMHGIGGWGGFRRNGLFEVRRFGAPATTPVAYIDRPAIMSCKRQPLPTGIMPPPFRQRIPYDRNWTGQTDVAGVVSAERRAYLAGQFRLAEASAQSIKTDYPSAQDPEPRQTYFRDKADAEAEALRLLNLYRVERALYRLELPRQALHFNLGDTINITYDRWDLSVGRNMRIVEMNENVQRPKDGQIDRVEVIAYG